MLNRAVSPALRPDQESAGRQYVCANARCNRGGVSGTTPSASPRAWSSPRSPGRDLHQPRLRFPRGHHRACPVCGRNTSLTTARVKVCVNASCPSHTAPPRHCHSCGTAGLLEQDGSSYAASWTAPFPRNYGTCFFCKEASFDLLDGLCIHKGCPGNRPMARVRAVSSTPGPRRSSSASTPRARPGKCGPGRGLQ